nr:MAG TPA: hypothetical protein [Caudoviricetes sp.]
MKCQESLRRVLWAPPNGEKIRQSSLRLSCPAVLMSLNHEIMIKLPDVYPLVV